MDIMGIYKITNLINQKSYIGQSTHINRRWQEHCQPSAHSVIGKAIQKYGKDNFVFEIIEKVDNQLELNEKEAFYIQHFNTIIPNGYNVIEESLTQPTNYIAYGKDIFNEIVDKLLNTTLTFEEIGDIYNLDRRTISRINNGHVHKQTTLAYPLRDTSVAPKEERFCVDCGKPITSSAIRCDACNRVNRRFIKTRPSKEELKELIKTNAFTKIGEMFNVSDNCIRKWCKDYGLPSKSKEIKSMSKQDWENL